MRLSLFPEVAAVRYALLSILVLSTTFRIDAQTSSHIAKSMAIASPTAASIAKYGDIPVSYHTGTPNIDLPIYTVKAGSLTMPIGLSYHASGLKVQEQASWVGAGWSLNAGGVIIRSVMGAPDDRGLQGAAVTNGYFSDYGYYSYLFTPSGSFCDPLQCPDAAMTHPADDYGIGLATKDGEPDYYFFNFNGITGKFYFSDDRTPVIVPQKDLKIEVNYPSSSNNLYGIHGFTITTNDGTKYYFGKNTVSDGNIDAIETNTFTSAQRTWTGQGCTSAWYLNRIVSADELSVITLTYQKEQYSYYALSTFPKSNVQTVAGAFDWAYEYDIVKNFIDGVRLNKIQFEEGEVVFTPGSSRTDMSGFIDKSWSDSPEPPERAHLNAKTLGSIAIQSGSFCKKMNFNYNYFFDGTALSNRLCQASFPSICNNIQSDKYRLKLESVQETACDGSVSIPPYTFTYFSETVPRKLSFGLDHWGFYNGVTINSTLIPTYTIKAGNEFQTVDGANRDANWPAMRGGTLQKITYPTGGSNEFEFEPHKTAVNRTGYTKESRGGTGVGYDGPTYIRTINITLTGNPIELNLGNSNGGSDASVHIYSGGTSMASLICSPGTTKTGFFQIPPGTYQLQVQKNSVGTGVGASGGVHEWMPFNISTTALVGGLRIKTITQKEGNTAPDVVTNYTYGPQSTGILYSRPVYLQIMRNEVYKMVGNNVFSSSPSSFCSLNGCLACDGSGVMTYLISPSSIRPLETSQGNHMGYNEVTVAQTGNGSTVYRYYGSNIWDNYISDVCTRYLNTSGCDANIPSYPDAPLPFEPKRGELKYEGHYNEAGHIVKDNWYFPEFQEDAIQTPGYIVKNIIYIATIGTGFTVGSTQDPTTGSHYMSLTPTSNPFAVSYVSARWGTEYMLKSYRRVMDSIVTTTYNPGDGNSITSTNVMYFNSPYHYQLTQNVVYSSKDERVGTTLRYATDFRIGNCDAISTAIQTFNTASSTNWADFLYQRGTCTGSGNYNCRYQAYQAYRFRQSLARKQYIQTRTANFTNPTNNFNNCLVAAKNAANTDLKPILELQVQYHNPVLEQYTWRNEKLTGARFTKYNYVTSPAGKVYPEKMQVLDIKTPVTNYVPATVSGSGLTKDSRLSDESSLFFTGGALVQSSSRDGVDQAFLWDYTRIKPIAVVYNARVGEVAFTSFENGNAEGNWTISHTARNTANNISGQKSFDLTPDRSITTSTLAGKPYTVSYWSTNGPVGVTANGVSAAATNTGLTKNGWACYEHMLPNTTTSVSVTGNNTTIDELRLYPVNAEMETACYAPLLGVVSSCDKGNKMTYYQYDGLGRLVIVKDQDGNIRKTVKYAYKN